MDTHKVAGTVTGDALAYEALDGVLRAHASLDALTAHSPEALRAKIRSIHASIARSARELDNVVRQMACGSSQSCNAAPDPAAFFAENDVEELVESLPGLSLHGTP
jgi:hypothetical protein